MTAALYVVSAVGIWMLTVQRTYRLASQTYPLWFPLRLLG